MSDRLDMPANEFRAAGGRVIEWIARYLETTESYPVMAQVEPGAIKSDLSTAPPERGDSLDAALDDFERVLIPGITHWNHPCFFAYFGITGSGPGIIGELLSAALNVNAMLWQTSPAATELEEVTLDWLRQLVGLPGDFEGVITDTASMSTLLAIAAARHAVDPEIRSRGMAGRSELPPLRIYTSEQAHSSVDKAAIALGLGTEGVARIETDDAYRMRPDALEEAVAGDTAAGVRPVCVVATVGTTSTTSSDPVPEIAAVCERADLWLHVDAAYAGSAAIIPERRDLLDGCDRAASIVINPHKWLFTPIDCSALYTRRPDLLRAAFSLVPEYLRTDAGEDVTNYMDYGIQLGRRFRALKLWLVLRYFGSEGIAERLREHIRLASEFAGWVDQDAEFERLAPAPLSVVCFRARPRAIVGRSASGDADEGASGDEVEGQLDRFNEALLGRLNRTGEVYLSHTRLEGRYTLRLAIGNLRTTEEHVERAWALIQRECRQLVDSEATT